MQILYTKNAAKDIKYWQKKDITIINRIKLLIENIKIDTFSGIGKPEPLKYHLKNYWSRRINSQHRLIYRIDDKKIIIIQCRYHY
jgi:toxin YoeB